MRDLFPGFYDRTAEEFLMLWREATFVFDTNMLLNVYRYQEETRNIFFKILDQLQDRIWAPHQAIYEYQNNRLEVISQQFKKYNEVSQSLKEAQDILAGLKHLKEKHSFIRIEEIIEAPMKALGVANSKLSAGQNTSKQEFEKLKASDSYREKVTQLFQSRTGAPYRKDQLLDIYRQADKRFELQIPPGWKDKSKKTYDKYGDVILWFQLIDYAHAYNKPIIFVTDDIKADWFLPVQESNGYPRPRPELVQEMFVEGGVLLHVYQGYEFFEQATRFLGLEQKRSVTEDVKEVSERNAVETLPVKLRAPGRLYSGDVVERIVQDWLESTYPNSQLLKDYQKSLELPRLNFLMIDPDGTRTGVEIRYFHLLKYVYDVVSDLLSILGRGQGLDKMIAFIVTSDFYYAISILEMLENKVFIPENVSLIIGHLEPDFQFH